MQSSKARTGSPLDQSDFTDVPEPKAQAIVLWFADTGHGKTTSLLQHCPGPIAFCDINRRGYRDGGRLCAGVWFSGRL